MANGADNVVLQDANGNDYTVSTDNVGGVDLQRIKMQFGIDGVATDVSATSPLPTKNAANGVGSIAPTPTFSTNGTPIGTPPANASGVRIYLKSGESLTYTIQSTAPTSAPAANTVTTASFTQDGRFVDEPLNGQQLYITAGSAAFRWM